MYLLELNREDVELSAYEARAFGRLKRAKLINSLLLFSQEFEFNRLALSKNAYQVICHSQLNRIKQAIDDSDIEKHYDTSYSVRIRNTCSENNDLKEKEVGGWVWKNLEKPRIFLKNPYTEFVLFIHANHAYFCKKIWNNNEPYETRKSHLRPAPHPTSLNPRLARAMVNILNRSSVLDPFCGSGGILIEAGLAGCRAEGYDLDRIMLKRARLNLDHYGLQNVVLKHKDALSLSGQHEGIVTDLPYGRNSKADDLDILYSKFMNRARNHVTRMVISFPSTVQSKRYLKEYTVEKQFRVFLHRNLSKDIFILKL